MYCKFSIKPPSSNGLEMKKPPEGLNRGFTVCEYTPPVCKGKLIFLKYFISAAPGALWFATEEFVTEAVPGGTPSNGLHRKGVPQRATLIIQASEVVEVYESVRKRVIYVCKKA